jgi:hypothetical protein
MIVLFAGLSTGQAAAIQLEHHGWDRGGPLNVWFDGMDLDASGAIEQAELNVLRAEFVLPAGGTTTWTIVDIRPNGFVFASPENFLISLWNGEYLLNDEAFEGHTSGSVADVFLFPIAVTDAPATVVPEPSSAALTALGLGVATFIARRGRKGTRELGVSGRATVRD